MTQPASPPPRAPEPRWLLLQPAEASVQLLVQQAKIDPLVARLLVGRGVTTAAEALAFLTPPLRDLPDPHLMADAEKAAVCIAKAIERRARICIYGDYDVDGVSAAALLHGLFERLGHPAQVFLPDRMRDGYGLHAQRLAELADSGVELFIAVDCGTTAVAEIAALRARGLEFIVCDHHALGPVLPDATALMNPQRPDCRYPDKHLCAVGVALVLAQALRRALGPAGLAIDLKDLLEFAALGTIADVVQLRFVNRTLAWHGLRHLGHSKRAGIQALAAQAGPQQGVGADRVGFHLGPRINAAGRVADARTAFQLLTTADPAEAQELAVRIETENNRRRTIQGEVVRAAVEQARQQEGREHAVVVAGQGWHPGVVGIVASRLKDEFAVPSFVFGMDDDGLARGSGRSVPGYDLTEGLRACCGDGLAERFGGHAFAAGVTLAADRVATFRERLVRHVESVLPPAMRHRDLHIDLELGIAELSFDVLERIDLLEPFGKGNARPTILLRGVELAELQVVGQGRDWVRGKLAAPGREAVWARPNVAVFGSAAVFGELRRGDCVDAVVRLERNSFQGRVTLQATIEGLRAAGGEVATAPPGYAAG